jgi:hypothetical protein
MAERDGAAMIDYPAWTEYGKKNGLAFITLCCRASAK